ncbi:MAG: hypothetical protein LH660_03540 [Phormidesmis sp. CAN_BIN36]|nr:hypothetical protein [Phormidesmis sp. CAN_BIN36]
MYVLGFSKKNSPIAKGIRQQSSFCVDWSFPQAACDRPSFQTASAFTV